MPTPLLQTTQARRLATSILHQAIGYAMGAHQHARLVLEAPRPGLWFAAHPGARIPACIVDLRATPAPVRARLLDACVDSETMRATLAHSIDATLACPESPGFSHGAHCTKGHIVRVATVFQRWRAGKLVASANPFGTRTALPSHDTEYTTLVQVPVLAVGGPLPVVRAMHAMGLYPTTRSQMWAHLPNPAQLRTLLGTASAHATLSTLDAYTRAHPSLLGPAGGA